MIRGLLKFKHTRLFFTPRMDIPKDTPKPHEIAESEEKELTDWGTIQKKDTGLDDAEIIEAEREAHLTLTGMNGVMITYEHNPKFDVEKMKWTTSIS